MIRPRYRRDYDGEFVITQVTLRNGQREETREWIPNAIENHHISGRAAVIGSDLDKHLFDFTRLQRHKGGLLGKKRLQTYGSNALWTQMIFDFYITQDRDEAANIRSLDYDTRSTIYTTSSICMQNPGRFYIIPYQPTANKLALSIYLAAFDGHNEIFLLGYTKELHGTTANWIHDVNAVIAGFPEVKFYAVGTQANIPDVWKHNINFSIMDYVKFVSYCDV
jgi:hypothetical protein